MDRAALAVLVVLLLLALAAAGGFFFYEAQKERALRLQLEAERALLAKAAAGAPGRDARASSDGIAREIRFADVTEEAGIRFRHEAGARGKKYNPETFGAGAGWFDYDGDGRIDLLLVNGNLLDAPADLAAVCALYRNLGDGRFQDVTERAGLSVPLYGMGFVSADVEGDGDQDLFLYGLHRSILFVNEDGRFRDATGDSGLHGLDGWVCAAAFFDYDRDGHLDLFVGNYVEWSPDSEEGLDCHFGTARKKYCPVAMFSPTTPRLFRGRGDGSFEETTDVAGLSGLKGKTLGVAVEDYDRDGDPDLFVANDSVPNFLLRNGGDGRFEDRGVESGFATDADGAALAGMGIDTAWSDDGGPLLVVTGNFSGEPTTFHVQEDRDFFVERSLAMSLGNETLDSVTFGLLFVDIDLDGNLDLLQVNGHVFDVEAITQIPYRQPPQLFLGDPDGKLREWKPERPDPFLSRPIVGRALAAADYDGDGDLDIVVTENQGPARLFRNDTRPRARYLRVDLRGTKSNRDAIGAEVTLRSRLPGGRRSRRWTRKAASSYLAQSERRMTFGLLDEEKPRSIEVAWPSGLRERFGARPGRRELALVEGQGAPLSTPAEGREERRPRARNSVVLRQEGVRLFGAGRIEAALQAFETAVRIEPRDFAAQRCRLVALWKLRRSKDLEDAYREVVELFPSASFLIAHFALVLRETGYRELAARFFLEAGRLEPRRIDVWVALGNLAFDEGELERALAFFAEALELDPGSLEALANTGKIHTIRKRYGEAVPFLERAIEIRPDFASALSTLGGVRIAQGDYGAAERYLLDALEHARSDNARIEVYGNLGILYYRTRDLTRSAEYFEKVLEIDPQDRQARRVLERLKR